MARNDNGAWLAIGVAGAVAAAGVAMGRKGSKNGRPTYYRLLPAGSQWCIYASPSNVIVSKGSKSKMKKLLDELHAEHLHMNPPPTPPTDPTHPSIQRNRTITG
jgi:hypothetical protein